MSKKFKWPEGLNKTQRIAYATKWAMNDAALEKVRNATKVKRLAPTPGTPDA